MSFPPVPLHYNNDREDKESEAGYPTHQVVLQVGDDIVDVSLVYPVSEPGPLVNVHLLQQCDLTWFQSWGGVVLRKGGG